MANRSLTARLTRVHDSGIPRWLLECNYCCRGQELVSILRVSWECPDPGCQATYVIKAGVYNQIVYPS